MLVQKFLKASQEKHLLRGFSICGCGRALPNAGLARNVRSAT